MGGCCCCLSKSPEINSSPTFFHLQYPVSEEHEPLSSHHATVLTHSVGLLVDTNLDTSVPDTYRPPPAPIPYETHVGPPLTPSRNQENSVTKNETISQTTDTNPVGDVTNSRGTLVTKVKDLECDEKGGITILKDVEAEESDELKKFIEPMVPQLQDEDDVCPTCLEEYEEENPRIITKCEHHFHLACILEWMERSDTCPVCDKEMIFSPSIGG